jgi:glycosyltransferase involved in cell wall biosynthesis
VSRGAQTTVMMPAYESHATVRESVESVLGQTLGDLEIIVVDDSSSTPIADALSNIRDERLRILRHDRNRGAPAARNTALRAATTPFVSQLDSDDIWHPDYLESVLPRFDDPEIGLVYSNVGIRPGHPGDGRTVAIIDDRDHPVDRFPRICNACEIPSATPTMRRHAVVAVRGYARWLPMVADYHLYLKLARAGWRFDYVPRVLATYTWPTAERGVSYDRDAVLRDEKRMWITFMLRHPLTPGPRRKVRTLARFL